MIKKLLISLFILVFIATIVYLGLTLTNEVFNFLQKMENKDGYAFSLVYSEEAGATIYADCAYQKANDAYAFRFALSKEAQLITYRMMFTGGSRYRIAEPSGSVPIGVYSKTAAEVSAEDNIIYSFMNIAQKMKWISGFLPAEKDSFTGSAANRYGFTYQGTAYTIWFQNGLPSKIVIDPPEKTNVTLTFSSLRFSPDLALFRQPEKGVYVKSNVVFDFFFRLF